MKVVVNQSHSLAPGDIRVLGAGDVVVLTQSARENNGWDSILPALLIAINRGASVVWQERTSTK